MDAVNRFMPDTLRDAIWRPISMAVPDAGLYIEILAPDLRFAILLALMAITAVIAIRRRPAPGFSPTWLLIAFAWLAFIPWLATTGNGRYFIAVLLLAGPLCIALIHRLPMTAGFRICAALIVVGAQIVVISQSNPWGRWPLAFWSTPYFDLPLDEQERSKPAAYITITSISYSLIAPMFPAGSRWMNIASLSGEPEVNIDDRRAQAFLQRVQRDALPLKVLAPTVPMFRQADGQPTEAMRNEIDRLIGRQGMRLVPGRHCKVVLSRNLAAMATSKYDSIAAPELARYGFWICDLEYPVARPPRTTTQPENELAARVFSKLESACPRIFPPGQGVSSRVGDGVVRSYGSSDTKVYVLDDDNVVFKYWRALNPARVGTIDEVLAPGFTMNCNAIRGRSGLPWEKEI